VEASDKRVKHVVGMGCEDFIMHATAVTGTQDRISNLSSPLRNGTIVANVFVQYDDGWAIPRVHDGLSYCDIRNEKTTR